jgi:hypothetical protein
MLSLSIRQIRDPETRGRLRRIEGVGLLRDVHTDSLPQGCGLTHSNLRQGIDVPFTGATQE